mgnify:FL=1
MRKGKFKKVLALAAMLIMVFAMGTVVYARKTHAGRVKVQELQKGDIVAAGTVVEKYDRNYSLYLFDNNDKEISMAWADRNPFTPIVPEDAYVEKIETRTSTTFLGGGESTTIDVDIYLKAGIPEDPAEDSGLSEEQKAQLRAEAWKRSPQNPKNYLPEVTLADGSTVVSTVPAHYMSGKDGGVSAVFSTAELGDFYRALGVSGGNGVHLYSYKSLCGPLMKQLIADHAAALSEKCGAEVTVADIFEMQAEIRDKNYKLVEVVTESSEAVDIVIGLQGELLKAAEAGADFAVLVYADGEMTVCMDTDEEVSTLTIHTTKTSGIYAIVYAPAGAFAGLE